MSHPTIPELRALAEAAGGTEWEAEKSYGGGWYVVDEAGRAVAVFTACYESCSIMLEPEDARFIAATDPETILRLCDEVERAERLCVALADGVVPGSQSDMNAQQAVSYDWREQVDAMRKRREKP